MTEDAKTPAVKTIDPNNIDPQAMYTARLELRSKGREVAIVPHSSWSHQFTEQPTGPEQVPASYAAMAQIVAAINHMMTPLDEDVLDELPDDPEQAAELLAAIAAKEEYKGAKDN